MSLTNSVALVSENTSFVEVQMLKLRAAGFVGIIGIREPSDLVSRNSAQQPEFLFLHLEPGNSTALPALRRCRERGFDGVAVALTSDPSLEELYTATAVGADDYLFVGGRLDLGIEALHFAAQQGLRRHTDSVRDPSSILRLRIFHSLGFGRAEVELLIEFARDFPRLRELADRLGRQYVVVRKLFSKIYDKLRDTFAIDNHAQLAYFVLLCEHLSAPLSAIVINPRENQLPHSLEG